MGFQKHRSGARLVFVLLWKLSECLRRGERRREKFLSSGDLFVIWVWYHRLSDFFAVCEIRWAPKAPTRLAFSVGKLNLFTRAEPFALIDRQGWVCNLSVDVNAARWNAFIYQNMTGALITHEESEMCELSVLEVFTFVWTLVEPKQFRFYSRVFTGFWLLENVKSA